MVKIEKLYKIYNQNKANEFTALKDINLQIEKNEVAVLKGVSGSGKTTLLSIIGALKKPTSGLLEVDGEQVARLPDGFTSKFRSQKLGFVFQSFNLFNALSVKDNVIQPLIPLNLKKDEIEQKLLKALELANISHKKDEMVQNLSGGEKQRVAIARALINEPEIILCDEPTANLDKQNSLNFIETIKELKALGKTVVVATHDSLFEEFDFIDKIIKMENGQIVE